MPALRTIAPKRTPRFKRSDMEGYQANGLVPFMKRVKRCAVWADMGSGKTISTLTALLDLFDAFDADSVLVVAPLRVARKTWSDEIQDWSHTNHLRFLFLDGSIQSIGSKILKNIGKVDVWGISCDKVRLLATLFKGKHIPWDTIVIDESSRFKNGSAKRSQALKLLTARPERIIELTGTPSPNGLKDLWHQMYILDRGERLGTTQGAFEKRWFKPDDKGVLRANKAAKRQIMDAISDIVYVLRPEEFTSVKKPLFNDIRLQFPTSMMQRYRTFEKDFILNLPLEGGQIKANNTSALAIKLLQFCSGAVYDENMLAKFVHRQKVEALEEIAEDNPGKSILVAYNFKHEIPRIQHSFPEAELFGKDPAQQDRWNAGEIPMLIAHPKSAAHGLNLQFGGHILVWFSFPGQNLEDYLQMNKRLPRPGQLHQVIIHRLITEGTADEMVMRSLLAKNHEQESFQAELKDRIEQVLKEAGR